MNSSTLKYLEMESKIIESTNLHFNTSNCNVQKIWYVMTKDGIESFNNLANAMLSKPEYVIFDRHDNTKPRFNYTRLYFDKWMNHVPFLELKSWKIGEVFFDYYNTLNTYDIIDPTGESRKIKLSAFFPNVYSELQEYMKHESFSAYDQK